MRYSEKHQQTAPFPSVAGREVAHPPPRAAARWSGKLSAGGRESRFLWRAIMPSGVACPGTIGAQARGMQATEPRKSPTQHTEPRKAHGEPGNPLPSEPLDMLTRATRPATRSPAPRSGPAAGDPTDHGRPLARRTRAPAEPGDEIPAPPARLLQHPEPFAATSTYFYATSTPSNCS
jgi:hypothetical protein